MKKIIPFALALISAFFVMLSSSCGGKEKKEYVMLMDTVYYTGRVNAASGINMRAKASSSARLITHLNKDAEVFVLKASLDSAYGWVYVADMDEHMGFVATKYLDINYNDVMLAYNGLYEERINGLTPEEHAAKQKSERELSFGAVPPVTKPHAAIFSWLMGINEYAAIGILAAFIVLEFIGIYAMRGYYRRRVYPDAWIAYVVVLLSAVVTICGLPLILHIKTKFYPVLIYTLLILSTACLMIQAAWRIKMLGMDDEKYLNENEGHYQAGRWIGNVLWLVLLVPFALIWMRICTDSNALFFHFKSNFWNMLAGCVAGPLLNGALVALLTLGIMPRLFRTANQGVYYIMTFLVALGSGIFFIRVIWAHFNSGWVLLPTFLTVCTALAMLGTSIMNVAKSRCPNCHSMDTEQTGRTVLGSHSSTSTSWRGTSSSGIRTRHSGAEIIDPERQVRTTTYYEDFETHHRCQVCGHDWDVEDSVETGSESHDTGRRRWTERY